jgi:hypothetical protein
VSPSPWPCLLVAAKPLARCSSNSGRSDFNSRRTEAASLASRAPFRPGRPRNREETGSPYRSRQTIEREVLRCPSPADVQRCARAAGAPQADWLRRVRQSSPVAHRAAGPFPFSRAECTSELSTFCGRPQRGQRAEKSCGKQPNVLLDSDFIHAVLTSDRLRR